jgi:hypothetical protein
MTDKEQVLLESQSARSSQLSQIEDRAEELQSKAKALHFKVWQGTGIATTERDSLRKLINAWCRANNIEHEKAWRTLYAELLIRDGFSVNSRIKNSQATSKLKLVAEHGKLGILYAIATEIFNVHNGALN